MTKCIHCKKEISAEEMKARYNEIVEKYGVIPMLVPICKECRTKSEENNHE